MHSLVPQAICIQSYLFLFNILLIAICDADFETQIYAFFVLVSLFPPRVSMICSHSCYENFLICFLCKGETKLTRPYKNWGNSTGVKGKEKLIIKFDIDRMITLKRKKFMDFVE